MRVFITLVFLLITLTSPIFATTLFSTDFESSDLSGWTSSGGSTTATISGELVRSGSYAIKVQHDKTSSYGFQYTILNIEGGMFYEVSGYGKTTSSNTGSFFIRVAWYAEGSTSQLSSPNDSNAGDTIDDDWLLLAQTIQAPATANSAKVRLVLVSKMSGQLASAYFDDVTFKESVAPTLTPTSIPEPTSTPKPASTPKPTSTPKPEATEKPANTPIPTNTPASEVVSEEVLGEAKEAVYIRLPTLTASEAASLNASLSGIISETATPSAFLFKPWQFLFLGFSAMVAMTVSAFKVYLKSVKR